MSIGGWTFLAILAIVAITVFYRKGWLWILLTLGIMAGAIIAFVYSLQGNKFEWGVIMKAAIIGALAGAMAEWLGVFLKQRRQQ